MLFFGKIEIMKKLLGVSWFWVYYMTDLLLQSTITCPKCNGKTIEQMPTNYCQYFWECPHCKNNLKPKKGDCCVYCSYGNVKCPPIQKGECC